MKNTEILFLGTCACDYSPKLSAECKDVFDLDARRSSSVLVDGHILIDCGDHVPDALRIAKIDAAAITDIAITHLHRDHFRRDHIRAIAGKSGRTVRLWAREGAPVEGLCRETRPMCPGVTYEMGDYRITGLKANHDEKAYPQYIYLEHEDKRLLYATDGAWLLNETYYWLKNKKLTALILDATCGDYVGDFRMAEHNSIPMIRLMLPSLVKWGVIDGETEILLTHIAPSLHEPHEKIVKSVEKDGLRVAYDGLKITI